MPFKKIIVQCDILNNSPVRSSDSLLKSSSGEGEYFFPNLTGVERHDPIGGFFLSKEISLADTEYRVK